MSSPEATRSEFLAIDFGDPSAENEPSVDLLDEGYVDPAGIVQKIFDERKFLVLGRKGCGKSALAKHLDLRAANHNEGFVTALTASELLGMLPDGGGSRATTQGLHWCFLLQLYASLAADQSLVPLPSALQEAFHLLEARHLLTPERLAKLIHKRETKITDPVLKMIQVTWETLADDLRQGPEGAQLARRLISAVCSVTLSNWHVLLVDGFEDEFERLEDMRRVADLIRVARQLNREFGDAKTPVIIVLLLRPDIYDALDTLKDKTKLVLSSGIRLEWFSERGWESDTSLGRLIDRRAALSLGHDVSVARDYLDWQYRGRAAHRNLAAYTRATPRDVVVLLRALQTAANRRGLSPRALQDALEEYALDYVRDEIRDEVELHVEPGTARETWTALRRVRGDIRLETLIEHCPEGLDPMVLLRVLYDCGALGQKVKTQVAFRYSSPHYQPDWENGPFVPHRAVAHVLRYGG